MTQTEYDQKKRECWEELWNDLIKDKAPVDFPTAGDIFEYVFSKAYALGKQAKDAEGEEILTVPRRKVQEMYARNDAICNAPERPKDYLEPRYEYADAITLTLADLFGSKCLRNESASEVASEPKSETDKCFDSILKGSFRSERRLNIATQIMSSILSNQMMLNNLAHGETTTEGVVKCIVNATIMYTDALIAECKEGGSDGN